MSKVSKIFKKAFGKHRKRDSVQEPLAQPAAGKATDGTTPTNTNTSTTPAQPAVQRKHVSKAQQTTPSSEARDPEKAALAKGILEFANLSPNDSKWLAHTNHNLDIIKIWFGSFASAKRALQARQILVLGSGRGEMSIALAYFTAGAWDPELVSTNGKVLAIEQPDYAEEHLKSDIVKNQEHISKSKAGKYIRWTEKLPYMYLWDILEDVEYMVLSHPHIDLMTYDLEKFMKVCRQWGEQVPLSTLLLAHWTKKTSSKQALAHAHALGAQELSEMYKSQRLFNESDEVIRGDLQRAGWKEVEGSKYIESPALEFVAQEDVEIGLAIKPGSDPDAVFVDQAQGWCRDCMKKYGTPVKCVDVWASSWKIAD